MFFLSLSLLLWDFEFIYARNYIKNSIVFVYDVQMQKMRTRKSKRIWREKKPETTSFSYIADHHEEKNEDDRQTGDDCQQEVEILTK